MTEKELLLTSVLRCSRSDLYSKRYFLNEGQKKTLSRCLFLRSAGVALQYILGECEFFGLKLKADKRALIPRMETELLAEAALGYLDRIADGINIPLPEDKRVGLDFYPSNPRARDYRHIRQEYNFISRRGFSGMKAFRPLEDIRILDIGTGSGCIALALAKNTPCKITAVDISRPALDLAVENARMNCLEQRIEYIQSDIFSELWDRKIKYGIIVSNPPYIPQGELKYLPDEVKGEPLSALNGGEDGLSFYRGIIKDAVFFLEKGGYLFFEIGFCQKEAVLGIIESQDKLETVEVISDYSGIERIIILRNG